MPSSETKNWRKRCRAILQLRKTLEYVYLTQGSFFEQNSVRDIRRESHSCFQNPTGPNASLTLWTSDDPTKAIVLSGGFERLF